MACSRLPAPSFTNDELKHRVRKIYAKFVSDVDPVRLSDFLLQENVIELDVKERILNTKHTGRDRCRALLDHLLAIRHPKAFITVRKALSEDNHHILEDIDNQEPEEEIQPRIETLQQGYKSSDPASPYYDFRQQMKEFVEKELVHILTDEAYSKVEGIIKRPRIKEDEIHQFWQVAFPYIIQRIKMWNGYIITAENLADLVIQKQGEKKYTTSYQTFDSSTKPLLKTKTSVTSVYPVSRLDCMTYLINVADCIVAHDILKIMSKFPMAIPLIIQDIREDDKYIATVPIIQNTVIKWESTPGQIVENHLFTSPFRMVAAIRLGTNKIGKSTILNQLFSKEFMFSSNGEAGSRYGRPCTLDGAVEIVWLTQATCSSPTWKMMSEFYRRNRPKDEVAILANLHGEALQHQETLKYLEKYVCSFLVFLMPDFSDKEMTQLKHCIQSKSTIQVLVDSQEFIDDENYMNTILTKSMSNDHTKHTLRCLLQESFDFNTKEAPVVIEETTSCHTYQSLRYTESLHCKQSADIEEIVRKHECFNIRQLLSKADIKDHAKWDPTLKRLIKLVLDITSLPAENAKKYLTHLEANLSEMSATESIGARAKVGEAKKKLRRIVKPKATISGGYPEDRKIEKKLKIAQQQLKSAMDMVDNTNLGLEHLFRTLCHMYEASLRAIDFGDFKAVLDLPKQIADLLINGHAIEILDGDLEEIQLTWIKAIWENVQKMLLNLKVFVISIIGLQSTGKSTLLNALFSCRFAVSVGRCSRGLFMRMVFMEEKLRETHECDAIILIDTEGLCSPEKLHDPKASQKDSLMATFAMGVSNLTIVNILGEGMTEMTEVLQVTIAAMARLRRGGIKPDILLVQHLQERNLSKIDQVKGQFCEAINKAFELISKNDVEIGSASEECLAELTARIHSGDIFKHFGAFRDGSSVNSPPSETYHADIVSLFETVLNRTRALKMKSTFERWSKHFESCWACVRGVNLTLELKNNKLTWPSDFTYSEKKIAKVKELNASSIRYHRELFVNKIREQINLLIEKKLKVRADSLRKHMLNEMAEKLQAIPHNCPDNCGKCKEFETKYISLSQEFESNEWGEETRKSLKIYDDRLHEITMKVLRQTFDGSVVKQWCFSAFSDLITEDLNQALKKRPTGQFSEEEQRIIVDNIWQHLQSTAASKESTPDLHIRMKQALLQTYVYTGIFPNILRDLSYEITVEDLMKRKAIKSKVTPYKSSRTLNYDKLTNDQMTCLIIVLEQLVMTVLRSRREDYSKIGLDFDEEMVSEIKTNFHTKMKEYEEKFDITLNDEFKMSLHIYTLQWFKNAMANLQTLFNRQNNRSQKILLQKKDDYINEIETRFKYGFSCVGEGEIVAKTLCKSIKLNAIQAGYDSKIQAVKDALWTKKFETVRLHYFEQLVKDVAAGKKERAVMHFANPNDSFVSWLANEIDSLHSDHSVLEIYRCTLKHEINRVEQQIASSDNKADIDKIVKEQIKSADDQYYSQLDPKDYDFDVFRISIVRILGSFMHSEDGREVEFGLASNDPEIQRLLGCCFVLGFSGSDGEGNSGKIQ